MRLRLEHLEDMNTSIGFAVCEMLANLSDLSGSRL